MAATAEQQFAEFYDATWSRTLACTYAMTNDLGAAEDLAQEAYTRAWPRWSQLITYDDPSAWVRQVATRQAVSRWRRNKVASGWLAKNRREPVTAGPDETSVALATALATLPEAQRRAIVLHHLADLSVEQVARLESCPAGTIKARLSRGRTALAAQLSDQPNGAPTHA